MGGRRLRLSASVLLLLKWFGIMYARMTYPLLFPVFRKSADETPSFIAKATSATAAGMLSGAYFPPLHIP